MLSSKFQFWCGKRTAPNRDFKRQQRQTAQDMETLLAPPTQESLIPEEDLSQVSLASRSRAPASLARGEELARRIARTTIIHDHLPDGLKIDGLSSTLRRSYCLLVFGETPSFS